MTWRTTTAADRARQQSRYDGFIAQCLLVHEEAFIDTCDIANRAYLQSLLDELRTNGSIPATMGVVAHAA